MKGPFHVPIVATFLSFCFVVEAKGSTRSFNETTTHRARRLTRNYKKFNIRLRNMGTNQDFNWCIQNAKKRWSGCITEYLEEKNERKKPRPTDWFDGEFSPNKFNGMNRGIVIGFAFEPLDGLYGFIGQAGAKHLREITNKRSGKEKVSVKSGIMRFDIDDFTGHNFTDRDRQLICDHEMGHVLGLSSSVWDNRCGSRCSLGDNTYGCRTANLAYKQKFGADKDLRFDVSSSGRCKHWAEESVEGEENGERFSELMTEFFDEKIYQPLTSISIGALKDLGGYRVNMGCADLWPKERDRMDAMYDGLRLTPPPPRADNSFTIKTMAVELAEGN